MSKGSPHLNIPAERDKHYGHPLKVHQYLLDLHENRAVFNFCGSIMFELALSPKLKEFLQDIGQQKREEVVIFDASKDRLMLTPGYTKSANADNVRIFHGREIRKVDNAAGGMGCVLHLSLADSPDDLEGWTREEVADYNGWTHDSRRPWRKGLQLEKEGFEGFTKRFGKDAFALHHRFYLHLDSRGQMWLAAEDGCEGEPVVA
jgi:hypothetical protein